MFNPAKLRVEEMEQTIMSQQKEVIEVKQSIKHELEEMKLDYMTGKLPELYGKILRLINELDTDIKNELVQDYQSEN